MKKILVIDSHKGTNNPEQQNLHLQNSRIIAEMLNADLIWSYPNVNDNIQSGYDAIVFVHASPYAFTDYEWVAKSPNAELFYITNEYNLGEPRTLWTAIKGGRKYTVIANHPHEPSKIVMKYVKDWFKVNLNALIFNPIDIDLSAQRRPAPSQFSLFDEQPPMCIYYGSFRKDRAPYFAKYLTRDVVLSTHSKNIEKFRAVGVTSDVVPRIVWAPKGKGIADYQFSLYIEDVKTHKYYNYLANRFYEALNYDVTPIFSAESINTIQTSGYPIPPEFIITDPRQIALKEGLRAPMLWYVKAFNERQTALQQIKKIIYGTDN